MFREYHSSQMESTNVTLLTGVMLMLNRITPLPPFPNTKYKCHIVSWDYLSDMIFVFGKKRVFSQAYNNPIK
jgi:hypothetical protein